MLLSNCRPRVLFIGAWIYTKSNRGVYCCPDYYRRKTNSKMTKIAGMITFTFTAILAVTERLMWYQTFLKHFLFLRADSILANILSLQLHQQSRINSLLQLNLLKLQPPVVKACIAYYCSMLQWRHLPVPVYDYPNSVVVVNLQRLSMAGSMGYRFTRYVKLP